MKNERIEYKDGEVVLEAYVATPDENKKRPAVLLLHAWEGRNEFVEQKANDYASKGYVGIALDTYGKGVRGNSKEECSALITPFMEDRTFLAKRLFTGFEMAKKLPYVDPNKMVAIGFCFGGLCVLDLFRHGADLKGAISVHGLLGQPDPNPKKYNTNTKVLALTGYNDPMVKPEQVAEFQHELDHSKADWEMVVYGNTMHAFTNPKANDKDFGTVYSALVAKRAFLAIDTFIEECFR